MRMYHGSTLLRTGFLSKRNYVNRFTKECFIKYISLTTTNYDVHRRLKKVHNGLLKLYNLRLVAYTLNIYTMFYFFPFR